MYEEYEGYETVKQRLILAGLAELQTHGIHDFSLRRVAAACNVSCAAPYKHFESKDNFISEIFSYIHARWDMLQKQVQAVFEGDIKKQITETCITYIKFWIANPHFRSVLMTGEKRMGEGHSMRVSVNNSINDLLTAYFTENRFSKSECQRKKYTIRSLVYGALLMLEDGEIENSEQTIEMIRCCIENEI